MASPHQRERERQGDHQAERDRPPLSEWLVALLGLLVVLSALGFLGYEAVAGDTTAPDPLIRVTDIESVGGGYLAQLEILNQGGDTAAGLTVEGTLTRGGRVVETSDVTLDYLPGGSVREAGLFFSRNPRQGRLELRALGFQEP